jgi:hypothetical protein
VLVLFAESLQVRFAVRVEKVFAALLPPLFEFGLGDVPVRPAFFGHGAQVLAEIFTVELNKPFSLPAVLGAVTAAAEHENHGMLTLQFFRRFAV